MRIVFAGTPAVAVPSLKCLVEAGFEVVGVVTRPDAPVGRRRVLTPSPVAAAAAELGLPVLKAARLGEQETEWVRALAPDLGVIVAYGGLVREPLLSLPREGWVNLHFSTLPAWRGAAPVQRALMAGETTLGVSTFRLVPELDAGRVLARDSREFQAGTTADEALAELSSFGTACLLQGVRRALAGEPGEEQSGETSYAHKLGREDGALDLTLPAEQVLARWAGVTSDPGAFVAGADGAVTKLLAVRWPANEEANSAAEATVPAGAARLVGKRVLLGTGTSPLELLRVQPAGKGAMDAAAWLRGRGGEVSFL